MKDQRPTFDHVAAMQCYPNLKEIRFLIGCKGARLSEVAEMEDALRLDKISFDVDCEGARLSEVEELEEALRHAAAVKPDCPVLLMTRINEDKMACTNRLSQ
jgi:hypothetical protein